MSWFARSVMSATRASTTSPSAGARAASELLQEAYPTHARLARQPASLGLVEWPSGHVGLDRRLERYGLSADVNSEKVVL